MKKTFAIQLLNQLTKEAGKRVFRLNEFTLYAQSTAAAAGMALLRLEKDGVVERAGELWINKLDTPSLAEIACSLKPLSYISFESALYQKGGLSQSPQGLLSVATTGRPSRQKTSLGTIEFLHIKKELFFGFDSERVAHPEKALLDLIYIRKKHGLDPLPPVTIYWDELKQKRLKDYARAYPKSVQNALVSLQRRD